MTDTPDQPKDPTPATAVDTSEDQEFTLRPAKCQTTENGKDKDLSSDSATEEAVPRPGPRREPATEQNNSLPKKSRRGGQDRRKVVYRTCEERRSGLDRRADTGEKQE